MDRKNKAVLGIYNSRQEAEKAVEALKTDGFSMSDISVLLPQIGGAQDIAHIKETKAPEGALTGAGTGAAIGGAFGLLVGVGALTIPGLGPLIAAGPIMAALAGIGVGGTVGGVGGILIGLGIPEYEAKHYENAVKGGGILLSVHTDNNEEVIRAKKSLEGSGARDISSAHEASEVWSSKTYPSIGPSLNP